MTLMNRSERGSKHSAHSPKSKAAVTPKELNSIVATMWPRTRDFKSQKSWHAPDDAKLQNLLKPNTEPFCPCNLRGGVPDDPGVDVRAADDKAIHEEDAKQQQHATSIGHHNLAGSRGHHPVDADPNLVGQEQQRQKHEEPAAP